MSFEAFLISSPFSDHLWEEETVGIRPSMTGRGWLRMLPFMFMHSPGWEGRLHRPGGGARRQYGRRLSLRKAWPARCGGASRNRKGFDHSTGPSPFNNAPSSRNRPAFGMSITSAVKWWATFTRG